MCSSIEDLHKHVPPDQLTQSLGGTLEFEHKEWIQHRAVSTSYVLYNVCNKYRGQLGMEGRIIIIRLQTTQPTRGVAVTVVW